MMVVIIVNLVVKILARIVLMANVIIAKRDTI